ncbi:MAG: hypothetical protein M3Y87_09930 [Myxococcota bacterium]|nr:hypothetical protein [Myxococcota bacterium]
MRFTDRLPFNDALLPVALTGLAGAALATAALPMLLPEEDGVPWWSWVVGAAGLGVGAAGAYFLATEGACYSNTLLAATCIKQSPNELLGALVLGHAAPLLASGARRLEGPRVELTRAPRLAPEGTRRRPTRQRSTS